MAQPSEDLIYKIVPRDQWEAARKLGRFKGASVDIEDGFIHFSTLTQVAETAAKHFAGQSDLMIVAVESELLGSSLRWEPSRGGDLFPHLYGDLHFSAVVWEEELPEENGRHLFPSQMNFDSER